MAIVGILAAAIALPLSMGVRAYATGQNLLRAHEIGRGAIWRMEREIRNLRKANLTTADASALTFTDAYQESISYTFSGGSIFRNGVLLADSILGLTFTYYDRSNAALSSLPLSAANRANVYRISMNFSVLSGSESYPFQEQIFPRDLRF